MSCRDIAKQLLRQKIVVSKFHVSNVLKNHPEGAANQSIDQPQPKWRRKPRILTPRIVKKINKFIDSDNPLTQRDMANNQILKPMMTVDVPALYGKEADKVVLHIDSAPAHVAAPVNK
ncbi:hypothetical protein BV898_18303 [Hypsibius exemplaris]|uniref:Uncharacterized protein n=1 Tax=Hypsibius exemplaris TaxID=2072580 RepID=A0A9X6RMX6_HYPEX|nr:hypothetical protein BV898_18303 [Hypsibius exemplaris]